MADNIVDDNPGVRIVVNVDAQAPSKQLPLAVDVIDEVDECSWAIRWAERHNCICPLDSVGALEGKFLLAVRSDGQLVVPRRGIKHPHPFPHSKFLGYCGVAPRDWIRDDPCDGVEWGVVDAKPPDELVDMADVLLMGLRHEYGFEEPTPIVYLAYVANLFQGSDGFVHDWNLLGAVHDLFHRDGVGVASVNDTFIVPDGNENATIIEDRPVLDNQRIDLLL